MEEMKKSPTLDELFTSLECVVDELEQGETTLEAVSYTHLADYNQKMASERKIIESACGGDIIGIFDPGIFSIGDTLTTSKEKYAYEGLSLIHMWRFVWKICRTNISAGSKTRRLTWID